MPKGHVLNLVGNCRALLAAASKTFYDLYWNKRLFDISINQGIDPITAAEQKRHGSDRTLAITFAGLAVSYLLFIFGSFL